MLLLSIGGPQPVIKVLKQQLGPYLRRRRLWDPAGELARRGQTPKLKQVPDLLHAH